jgi:hypothetical protein
LQKVLGPFWVPGIVARQVSTCMDDGQSDSLVCLFELEDESEYGTSKYDAVYSYAEETMLAAACIDGGNAVSKQGLHRALLTRGDLGHMIEVDASTHAVDVDADIIEKLKTFKHPARNAPVVILDPNGVLWLADRRESLRQRALWSFGGRPRTKGADTGPDTRVIETLLSKLPERYKPHTYILSFVSSARKGDIDDVKERVRAVHVKLPIGFRTVIHDRAIERIASEERQGRRESWKRSVPC